MFCRFFHFCHLFSSEQSWGQVLVNCCWINVLFFPYFVLLTCQSKSKLQPLFLLDNGVKMASKRHSFISLTFIIKYERLIINDVLNRNKNKPNDPVQTVPKKRCYYFVALGLHCNQITKRLKSCINNFSSFVTVKVIFQNIRRIKSFFPYKDRLN